MGKKYPVRSGPGSLHAGVGFGLSPLPCVLGSFAKLWLPMRVMPGQPLAPRPQGEILQATQCHALPTQMHLLGLWIWGWVTLSLSHPRSRGNSEVRRC